MTWANHKPPSGIPASGQRKDRHPLGDQLAPPGHVKTLHHGANSERLWKPVAAEMQAVLLESWPHLVRYPDAVSAYCRVKAQLLILDDWSERVGLLDEDGKPHKYTNLMMQLESALTRHRERLGLDPVSDAKLRKDHAEIRHLELGTESALEALQRRGLIVLERRRAELGIVPPPKLEDDHGGTG